MTASPGAPVQGGPALDAGGRLGAHAATQDGGGKGTIDCATKKIKIMVIVDW